MQLRLKELREDLGLSVKDMARDTGVSQNTIGLNPKDTWEVRFGQKELNKSTQGLSRV